MVGDGFAFNKSRVDEHIIRIGLDVNPIIELTKLDRQHLFDLGRELTDAYPQYYESLVQSPGAFNIRKNFILPGKGQLEYITFAVSPRGPVLSFPLEVAMVDEEIMLEPSDTIIRDIIGIFLKNFTGRNIFRIGLVNEYIFDMDLTPSATFACDKFTKIKAPPNGEIFLRVGLHNDVYNRNITIESVKKQLMAPGPGESQDRGYGLKVVVDFNNRVIRPLEIREMLSVLREAKVFNDHDLYSFLNKPEEF